LMKQDQMSMAASVESRVPFLDSPFVEYVATIPGRHKLDGWKTKAVLRKAIKDVVPPEILGRRKMGFPVPMGSWLAGDYSPILDDFVLGARARERGLFNQDYLRQMVAEHRNGDRDHASRLWSLINLEIWQRVFIDGESPREVLSETSSQVNLRAVA